MSEKAKPSKLFRKRDAIFLFLIPLAIFFSLDSRSYNYSLTPSWYTQISPKDIVDETDFVTNISPIITDLNGDGENEVIAIGHDLTLKLISMENSHSAVFHPDEKISIKISDSNIRKGKTPIAIKSGFIEQYSSSSTGRKQIVVVVLEDFTVQCYDDSLQLLWEKHVAHNSHELDKFIDLYKMYEVSVFVSPLAIGESEVGTIFVGSSMTLKNPTEVHLEQGLDMNEVGSKEHQEMNIKARMEHFSVYALDASNGHVIWRHEGMDVRPEQFIRSLPQNAFKIDLSDIVPQIHHAPNVRDWTVFRNSLLDQLPHQWEQLADTSMTISHFERKHIGAGAANQVKRALESNTIVTNNKKSNSKKQLGNLITGKSKHFSGIEYPPLSASAELPHDAVEHIANPNVLVAHTSKGLEVISLTSGQPITALSLPVGKFYADIDGDSIIDSIVIMESEDDIRKHSYDYANSNTHFHHCSMLVISGLPPKSQLFNGTLCQNRNSLQDPFSKHTDYIGKLPKAVKAATPVVLKVFDKQLDRISKYRDVIVAINTGVLTCYRGNGEFQWQTRDGPIWPVEFHGAQAMAFDVDAHRVAEQGSHDNHHAHVLVIGDTAMNLISHEGELLATVDLPSLPVGKAVLGDFDSDGVTDVLIVTKDALVGFRLEVTAATQYSMIACVILAILGFLTLGINIEKDFVNLGNNVKKGYFSIRRSTDALHID